MKENSYSLADKNLFIVIASALIVRLFFLFQFQTNLLFENHIVDMLFYHQQALAINNGQALIDGPFFRAPFYSYFIAGLYSLGGQSNWIFRIIQIILGSISCGLIFLIGRSVFTNRVGLIAGLFMALCGPLIFYDVMLLATTLTIFLNLTALWFLIRYLSRKQPVDIIIGGLALGLSAITRPNILFFALALFIWAIIALLRKKQIVSAKHLLILVVAIIIPIAPVTLHNYNQSGEFILIGAYGGINLYIGNYSHADGVSPVIPGVRKDWWGGFEDTKRIAETESGRSLSASEVSGFWTAKTLKEIAGDPGHFAGLLFKKIILLTSGIELSNNFDYYFFTRQGWLMKILIWPRFIFFPWGLIFPLALLGFLSVRKYQSKTFLLLLFALMYGLSIVMFLVSSRYRLPLLPVSILMAVYGVDHLIRSFKSYDRSQRLFSIVIPILFIVICNYDYYGYGKINYAHGYHTTASIYLQRGKISLAESNYQKALSADANLSETINDYAMLMANTNRLTEARKLLQNGHEKFPDDPTINYNLGFLYLQTEPDTAITYFRRSLEIIPDNLNALNNLGLAYYRLNQTDSAVKYFNRTITIEPYFENGYYNLAMIEKQKGNFNSALKYYQRIKKLQPDNYQADFYIARTFIDTNQPDSARYYLNIILEHTPPESEAYQQTVKLLEKL